MRTGSIYDVVEVLKSLSHLARSKSLSFREKRMLDRAKFLVVSEISEVMGEKDVVIDVRVEEALERCFSTKARNTARSVAAKATRAKATATPARAATSAARATATPAAAPRRAARAS
jgi:CarD family transcriptional regulator